jgi:predicted RNase H-like nuclease
MATTFIGIDASWKASNPSGVAVARGSREEATLTALRYATTHADVVGLVQEFRTDNTILSIDAPLIATNAFGNRSCETSISREFGQFHASAHSMNRPKFELYGLGHLVQRLEELGFSHGVEGGHIRTDGLRMFEVYPHPAHIRLFDRDIIIRYKRRYGAAQQRIGLSELCGLTAQLAVDRKPRLCPGREGRVFLSADLSTLKGKALKQYEDLLDAWTCAYLAMRLARWQDEGNEVFGSREDGYIIVPRYRRTFDESTRRSRRGN